MADELATYTLSIELEDLERLDLETYGNTTTDLRKLLNSLTAARSGQAAHWMVDTQPVISVSANVNGVTARALEGVVTDAYDAIAALGNDAPGQWPENLTAEDRKVTRRMVNRLRRQAPVALAATERERIIIPPTGLAGRTVRRVFASWGTADGTLDAINLHGQPRFTLFEHGTDYPVRCALPRPMLRQVKDLLGLPVRVHGFIYYRATGSPSSISEVSLIEPLQPPLRRLTEYVGSIPNITHGLPSGEFVRRLRAGGDE